MTSRRTLWIGVAALAAVLALVVIETRDGPAAPQLVGAQVDAADPYRVVLTFTDDPVAAESHVSVTDTQGAFVTDTAAPVTASGRTLVVRARSTASGVSYHAVFRNGRFVAGAASVDGSAPPAAASEHTHGVDPVGAVLLVVDGLAVLVFFAALMRRPRVPARERGAESTRSGQ